MHQNFPLILAIFLTTIAGRADSSTLGERLVGSDQIRLIDAVVRAHVPLRAAKDAFDFYDLYKNTSRSFEFFELRPEPENPQALGFVEHILSGHSQTIASAGFLIIFDLNLHSSSRRLHLIDLETGDVESFQAAHGVESDCGGRSAGYACQFISHRDSRASPLGFFSTGEIYTGIHGSQMRLNGLEASSSGFLGNAQPSSIVIHPAPYVKAGYSGKSHGCPAMNPGVLERIKNKLAGGALFYFYHSSLDVPGRNPVVAGLDESDSF